jgi:molybdopterin-binding protein
MTRSAAKLATQSGPEVTTVVKAVTVIMGTVVGLTFLFG